VDVVLTTGGTGLGPRDNTPEATLDIGERIIPGIAEELRRKGAEKIATAILSRGVAVLLVFFVLLAAVDHETAVLIARKFFLRATFFFTIISAVHYIFLVQHRLREHNQPAPAVSPVRRAS
jgi:molybdopterin biosynthesis enzyme MoaB